jgi:hypothetical protein
MVRIAADGFLGMGNIPTTFLFCESALITKPLRNLVGCAFLPLRCEEKEKGR